MKVLILFGFLLYTASAFGSGKYYVECRSENVEMSFATFGISGTEFDAHIVFQGNELNAKGFKIREIGEYRAKVENLLFLFSPYPGYQGDSAEFLVFIRLFGKEYHPLESGLCQPKVGIL